MAQIKNVQMLTATEPMMTPFMPYIDQQLVQEFIALYDVGTDWIGFINCDYALDYLFLDFYFFFIIFCYFFSDLSSSVILFEFVS